ncbi:MAG: ribosomal protein S18-alanine N-acetyltransferase [Clostridia bacterium]|nr:ribosomal protein S18-alanine N-acetyltransferase [Clostridia bacterium]
MEIVINKMTFSHLLKIQDKLTSDFDDFWTYSIFEKELENPNSKYFVALINEEIVGFAGIWKVLDETHITNIVTKISKRHMGIASKLLENLIETAKAEKSSLLTLEVNEKNTNAIKLYEKFNFKKIGLRKNYYGQNKNAIIMTLFLN